MKIPPNVFFACKHFGTGVLIATAFVHVSLNLFLLSFDDSDVENSWFLLPLPLSAIRAFQTFLPTNILPCLE